MLLPPCFQWAYLYLLLGAPPLPTDEDLYVRQLVRTLLKGAAPSTRRDKAKRAVREVRP